MVSTGRCGGEVLCLVLGAGHAVAMMCGWCTPGLCFLRVVAGGLVLGCHSSTIQLTNICTQSGRGIEPSGQSSKAQVLAGKQNGKEIMRLKRLEKVIKIAKNSILSAFCGVFLRLLEKSCYMGRPGHLPGLS